MNCVAMAVLLIGMASVGARGADDPESLVSQLASTDRITRVSALDRASQMPELPAILVDPIVSAINTDIEEVFTSDGARKRPPSRPAKPDTPPKIPVNDGDTSLVRIRANPSKFFDDPFTLTTAIAIGDDFPIPNVYDRDHYFSYRLRQFASDGTEQAEGFGLAYMHRGLGQGLTEQIASGVDRGGTHILAQIRCNIRRMTIEIGYPEMRIEITDYRTYNLGEEKWTPWSMEGIEKGFLALKHAKGEAIDGLIGFVSAERKQATQLVDSVIRSTAASLLIAMDLEPDIRQWIAEKVKVRRKTLANYSSPESQVGVQECDLILAAMQPRPAATPSGTKAPKSIDRSARAKTLFMMGSNLEKAGKFKPAIGYYEEIVEDFSDTDQASEAKKRIARLKGK